MNVLERPGRLQAARVFAMLKYGKVARNMAGWAAHARQKVRDRRVGGAVDLFF